MRDFGIVEAVHEALIPNPKDETGDRPTESISTFGLRISFVIPPERREAGRGNELALCFSLGALQIY
jgi:hypothetical protein